MARLPRMMPTGSSRRAGPWRWWAAPWKRCKTPTPPMAAPTSSAPLRPFLGGGDAPPPDHQELAARLGLPVPTLRTHIHRLRERYRATLRAEVTDTVAGEGEVQDELRHLLRVLINRL